MIAPIERCQNTETDGVKTVLGIWIIGILFLSFITGISFAHFYVLFMFAKNTNLRKSIPEKQTIKDE
jgi:hypothetical protein